MSAVSEPMHDVARIGHAELLTPTPDESLRFFVDVLGMEEEAREGQSVGQGDLLGTVGMTGNTTGPHLHYEVRFRGEPVDPMCYVGGRAPLGSRTRMGMRG